MNQWWKKKKRVKNCVGVNNEIVVVKHCAGMVKACM